ncbi:unnamed protein product [Adineta ricciae]|uniref:Uncharacterized protein n=1 Tax=Adineta ricciae TaxID=249248 RepID=A0A815Q6R5_ADIRI|nr:unnamed protein product [Adineta ricciae]
MHRDYYFGHLPSNVLALSGYEFFQFIQSILGEPEVNLLKKISVKTTSSFMNIEDPLAVLKQDIDDEELEILKKQLCFKMKNDNYLIKPGVESGFSSLQKALKEKLNQQINSSTKKKQQRNGDVSSISSLTLSSQEAKTSSFSLPEHKSHVLQLIKKWCNDNKENFNLENFQLEEDIDFTLNIQFDENSTVQATIKCKCGKLISLCRNGSKIQVSNYYKHLHSFGCSRMKEIKRDNRKPQVQQQQLQSTITSLRVLTSQSCVSPVEAHADEMADTQSTPNESSVSRSQSSLNLKRPIPSGSQHSASTKRSRR